MTGTQSSVAPALSRAFAEDAQRKLACGHPEAAYAAFRQAAALDPRPPMHNAYGCFLWRIGRYAQAAAEFARLLDIADRQHDTGLLVAAARNLAAVYRDWGNPAAAARFESFARGTVSALPDPESSDPCGLIQNDNAAADAILAGRYEEAELELGHSLLREMAAGSLSGEAADWGNLGVLAGLRGDLRAALRHFRRALRLHRQSGDRRGMGLDLLHLGRCAAGLGRSETALRLFQRATTALRRAGLYELAAQADAEHLQELDRQRAGFCTVERN